MKRWLGFFHSWLLPILLLVTCFGDFDTILSISSSQSDYHRLRMKSKNQLITKSSFNNDREPLIYVSTFDGKLFAISYQTGEVVWKVTNKFKMFVEAEYFQSNFNEDIYFTNNERMDNGNPDKNVSSSKFRGNHTVENEYIVPSIDGTLYQFKNNQYRIVTDAKKNFLDDSTSTSSTSNYIRSTATLKLIGVEPWSGETIYECNGAECSYPQFKDAVSSKKHHHHHMTANTKSTLKAQHLLVIESQMYHRFNTNLKYGYVNWNMSHNNIKLRYIDRGNRLDSYDDIVKVSTDGDDTSDGGDNAFIEFNANSHDETTNQKQTDGSAVIEREFQSHNNHTSNVIKYIRYNALHDILENTQANWKLHMNSPIVGLWSLSKSNGLTEHNLRNIIQIPYINDVMQGFNTNSQPYCDHSLLLFFFKGQPYFLPILRDHEEHNNNHTPPKPYCASIYSIKEYVIDDLQKIGNGAPSSYDIKALGLFDAFGPIEKVTLESEPNYHVYDKEHYFYKLKSHGSFKQIDNDNNSSSHGNNDGNANNLQLLPTPYQPPPPTNVTSDEGWNYFFNITIPFYCNRFAFMVRYICVIGSLITAFFNTIYFFVKIMFHHFSRLPESSPLTNRKGSTSSDVEADSISGDFVYADKLKSGIKNDKTSDPGGAANELPNESISNSTVTQPQPIQISRYMTDFKHIKKLGKGGFGHVYMAKNLIDECEYAIKRIRMPECSGARVRVMREVQALAKLNHPGVVRFYNAWFEPTVTAFDDSTKRQKNIPLCPTLHDDSELSLGSEEDDCFEHATSKTSSRDLDVRRRKPQTSFIDYHNPFVIPQDMIPSVSSTSINRSVDSYPASCMESGCPMAEHLSIECTHSMSTDLYIQMQLCQSQTLHDWLETNSTERNLQICINYFKQILMAIGYIHSQDFIHRDLKPSNIFFSMDGIVKIGDFGLVAHTLPSPKAHETSKHHPVKKSKSNRISVSACSDNINLHYYTKLVGTELYMAPEQNNCEKYDNTVDIYALALILTELVLPFKTQTERYITLNNMKKQKRITELTEKYPTVTLLVEWMLADDPKNRPTAIDILDSGLIQSLWTKYGLS